MKRIILLATAIAFSLTTIGYVLGLPPKTAPVKEGKALVKTLPKGVGGVELVANKVRLKSGFKFVKNPNGTVTAARIAGGHGAGLAGSFSCDCMGVNSKGTCTTSTVLDTIFCEKGSKDPCTGTCELKVTINGKASGLIMY